MRLNVFIFCKKNIAVHGVVYQNCPMQLRNHGEFSIEIFFQNEIGLHFHIPIASIVFIKFKVPS